MARVWQPPDPGPPPPMPTTGPGPVNQQYCDALRATLRKLAMMRAQLRRLNPPVHTDANGCIVG